MSSNFIRLGGIAVAIASAACTATISSPDGDGGGFSPGTGVTPEDGSPPPPTGLDLKGTPSYLRAIRLTNAQWSGSVQTALALPAPPQQLAEAFQEAVKGITDFTNNEQVLAVDARAWNDYQVAAEALAAQLASDPAALSRIYAGTDGAGFIATVGRRLYRRPLTTSEAAAYQALFDSASAFSGAQSNFAKGAGLVLEAMLQSPHFLYRTELGEVGSPLSGYEVAAKVSLWLRDSGPSDALLDAAASGELDTADGVASVVQRLIEEPSAQAVMRKFHQELLHFDRAANLSKVGVDGFDSSINAELVESSFSFFDKIFRQNLGVREIFASTVGFVGPRMAALYGVGEATGLVERDLGPSRPGYFLQLPFLMMYALNGDPDSIHRGVTMSLDVLCAPLGTFGAELPQLPARKPGQTNRARVDAHTNGCGKTCHNDMINPLGFAFDNFDGMGRYRQVETYPTETLPIDASGSFDFVEGRKSYADAAELMRLLSTSQQAHLCYSKKLASFALQRDIVDADMPLLAELAGVSTSAGGSLKSVMVDLVKQPAFRQRAGGAK